MDSWDPSFANCISSMRRRRLRATDVDGVKFLINKFFLLCIHAWCEFLKELTNECSCAERLRIVQHIILQTNILCKETYNRLIPLLLLLQLLMMIMRFNGNSRNYRIDTSLSCVYKTLFLLIKIAQLYNLIDTIIMQNTCQYTIRYFEHLKLVWNSSSLQLTVISYLHWHIKAIFINQFSLLSVISFYNYT